LAEDFNFNQAPRPPLILSPHPLPGPASNLPRQATHGAAAVATPPPLLQLTAVIARRQNLRPHHGRIYLTVSCSMACSIDAHGHLNLRRHRRHLGLRRKRAELAAHSPTRIALSLSRRNLAAVRSALRRHRRVVASIKVEATAAGGQRQSFLVSVRLSWH
jgi:hypothetical protein